MSENNRFLTLVVAPEEITSSLVDYQLQRNMWWIDVAQLHSDLWAMRDQSGHDFGPYFRTVRLEGEDELESVVAALSEARIPFEVHSVDKRIPREIWPARHPQRIWPAVPSRP